VPVGQVVVVRRVDIDLVAWRTQPELQGCREAAAVDDSCCKLAAVNLVGSKCCVMR
jgi:hypothetical protein